LAELIGNAQKRVAVVAPSIHNDVGAALLFGLKMIPEHKKTIKNMIYGVEWSHLTIEPAVRNQDKFLIDIIPAENVHYEQVMM